MCYQHGCRSQHCLWLQEPGVAVNTDVELEQATTIKDPNKFAATANAPAAAVNMVKAQKLGIRRGGG